MWRRALSSVLESFRSICDDRARAGPKSSRYLRYLNYMCMATVVVVPVYQKMNLVKTVSAASSSSPPWSVTRLNKRRPTLTFPSLPNHNFSKLSSRIHHQLQRSASKRKTALSKTDDGCNMKKNCVVSLTKANKQSEKTPAHHKKEDSGNIWWTHSGFYYGIGEELLKRHTDHEYNNSTVLSKTGETLPEMEKKVKQRIKTKKHVQDEKQMLTNSNKQDHSKSHIDTTSSPFVPDKDRSNEEYYSSYSREQQQHPETFVTILRDAVQEFRAATDSIRDDLASLKLEIKELKRLQRHNGYLIPQEDGEDEQRYYDHVHGDYEDEADNYSDESSSLIAESRRRAAVYDQLSRQIERWAKKLIREGGREEFGWKVVECNKLFKSRYDPDGQTKVYLKWMADPRQDGPTLKTQKQSGSTPQQVTDVLESTSKSIHKNNKKKEILFPCLKCVGTIDAPIETVCEYLADESRVPEYNDLVADFRDLEEISVNSKITWTLCPPVLFIKSRDFVTFCSHRWKRDGTQVVVNQALEHHKDAPQAVEKESEGGACRARALRGANLISPHPDDPLKKTCFTFLALADPGGGLPPWAMKAAVNAVAPIEPFKLYYKLRTALKSYKPTRTQTELLLSTSKEDDVASTSATGRSSKPAGLAQLGYACFWPKGGGLQEHHSHATYKVSSSFSNTPEITMDRVLNDSNLEGEDR